MEENEFLPLSALQHFRFCRRQCAFIHLEQLWFENRLTAEGNVLHEKVDQGGHEVGPGVFIRRSLPLRSLRLGISGIADVVEFHENSKGPATPFPIEYKRGRPKPDDCDAVQLCAQALCLEEMLDIPVTHGAFFYWATRHRHPVDFDAKLRASTEDTARALHEMMVSGRTPPPEWAPKCNGCSFLDYCKPQRFQKGGALKYLAWIGSQ